MNLYLASGRAEKRFVQDLYEAGSITRDEIHRRRTAGEAPIERPMAYFFTILRDLLGLGQRANSRSAAPPAGEGA
jgi:hypothetical protein